MLLISVSRSSDLEITMEDFNRAKEILELAEQNMGQTFGGMGHAKYSDSTEKIKDYIKNIGTTSRSVILARFYRDVDSFALKQIEEVLQQMNLVKITLLVEQGEKIYQWIGDKNDRDNM